LLLLFVHGAVPALAISLESADGLLFESHIAKLTDRRFLGLGDDVKMLVVELLSACDMAFSVVHPVN